MSVVNHLKPPNWDVEVTSDSTLFVETEAKQSDVVSEVSKIIRKDSSNVWALFVYSRHKKKVQWECPLCSDALHFGKTRFLLSLKLRILRHLGACHGIVHYNFEEHLYTEWTFLQVEFGTKIDIFQKVPKIVKQVEKHRSSINFITHLEYPDLAEIFGANAFCEICCEGVSSLDHLRKHGELENKLSFSEFFQCDEISIDEYPFPHPLFVYGYEETCSEQQTTSTGCATYKWHCRVPSCWNNIPSYFPTTVILKAHALRHFEEFHRGLFNEGLLDNEWSILHAEAGLIGVDLRRQRQTIEDTTCPQHFVHPSTKRLIPFEYLGHRVCEFCFFTSADEKRFRRHLRRHGYREEKKPFVHFESLKHGAHAVRELSIDFRKHLNPVPHLYGDKQLFSAQKKSWERRKGNPTPSSHCTLVQMVVKAERIEKCEKLKEENAKEESEGEYTEEHKDHHHQETNITMETELKKPIEKEKDDRTKMDQDQIDNENEQHCSHSPDRESDTFDSVTVEAVQKANHRMAKRKRSSVSDEQPIVDLLESYKQEGADSVVSKKAIKYLVEKLKNRETALDSLIDALKSKGASSTPCVAIPRTRSGKVQICFKMYSPQLLFARVWRWPNVTLGEIRKLECCGTSSDEPNTCVNPYHLGRSSQILNDSIVQELQKYAQEGVDPTIVQLVIHYLVNKLEHRTVDLEALKGVLKSKGKLPSPCVTIPRTDIRDRIHVGGTAVSSHTIWYRIWRCANVTKQRLRRLPCCVTSSDGPSMCVNPYHVERIERESSKSPRSISSMRTHATETRSHQSGSDSDEEQDNSHHFDRTSSLKQSLSTSAAVPFSSHSMFLEKLMSYRKANVDLDLEFARKAINYLLNKINVGTMDDLMRVLSTCARQSSTKCVTIPRTSDGRINVSGKCYPTHVVYASIWRWPNTLSARYLQRASYCRTTSIYQGVCINPYHYERIAQETKKTEAKTCARLKRKRQLNNESLTKSEHSSSRKRGKWEATVCTKSVKGEADRSEERESAVDVESVTNEETTDEETTGESEEKDDKGKKEKEGNGIEERSEEMEGEEPLRSCPMCSFRGTPMDTRQHYKREHVEKR